MKKRYLYLAALGLIVIPAAAQETYQSEKLIENDLNGTARYVGMGGAMEALGADISTISSNPAGIGLFRSSQVALSGGLVVQGSAKTSLNYDNTDISIKGHKNNASFDQIGFVWAHRTGNRSFLNFAFNYHKGQNFDQILSTAGSLIGQVNNNTIYAELTDEDLLNVQGGGALGKIEYIIKGSTIGGRLGGVKGAILGGLAGWAIYPTPVS